MDEKPKTTDNPDSVQATTTSEEDRKTSGQRRINIIWETTQAAIALGVTGTAMYVAAMLALKDSDQTDSNKSMAITAFLLISNTAFLIIGAYFSRTNHQRVGGVGSKELGETR